MNRIPDMLNRHLFHGIFIGMLAILLLRIGGTNALALALSCGQWNVVSGPNTGTSSQLNAVTAVSANNVWAVGGYSGKALIEHWRGKAWRIVKNPGRGNLYGVAAASANDIWAVGMLIEHWNGTHWSTVPEPQGSGRLFAVAAVSANDAWAVGSNGSSGSIIHWDGSSWSLVPNPSTGGELWGITAVSANDIWAVGGLLMYGGQETSLTLHWDGTQWSIVPSPNPPTEYCVVLQATTAIATNDVWAVGWYRDDCGVPPDTSFAEHWDGTQWSIDSILGTHTQLFGVAASSTNNVWAVGSTGGGSTLTYHWDGSSWNQVPDPNVKSSAFYGVAATPKGDFWAVGGSDSGALIEFYC